MRRRPALLGCAVGTVRSRLHRAKSLLLEKMVRQTDCVEASTADHTIARSAVAGLRK